MEDCKGRGPLPTPIRRDPVASLPAADTFVPMTAIQAGMGCSKDTLSFWGAGTVRTVAGLVYPDCQSVKNAAAVVSLREASQHFEGDVVPESSSLVLFVWDVLPRSLFQDGIVN